MPPISTLKLQTKISTRGAYKRNTLFDIYTCFVADAYSGPCQTFKMDRFAKIVNGLTILKKRSIFLI